MAMIARVAHAQDLQRRQQSPPIKLFFSIPSGSKKL